MKNNRLVSGIISMSVVMLLLMTSAASAYWIWTPETKKFVNPKYAVKDSPKEQFDYAMKFYQAKDYQKAAAEFMAVPKSDPAYARFDSSLLVAFDSMKKLAVPPSAAEKKPWIFELRTYQSHNESKGINKVQMFNSGEVALMRDVGLSPVFFAQTVVGSQMPNLVYMVSGENMEEHKKHWQAFRDAPVWKKLSGDPQYQDNVSKIVNIFLKRTPASQI